MFHERAYLCDLQALAEVVMSITIRARNVITRSDRATCGRSIYGIIQVSLRTVVVHVRRVFDPLKLHEQRLREGPAISSAPKVSPT